MAKKKSEAGAPISVKTLEEARAALEEMEEIEAEIAPKMARSVELKKAATEFAAKQKVAAIQLDGHYFRQIVRTTPKWDEDLLKEIVDGIEIKGKPLWMRITKRVLDPKLLNQAVAKGWIKEKKVEKAFMSTQGAPYLQRFTGEAVDGE